MPLDPKDPKNFDVFASIASGESSDHAAAASSSERAPTARPGTDLRGCGKRFGAGCQTIALSGYGDAHECCGHRGHAGNCRCWCAVPDSSPVVPEPHVEPQEPRSREVDTDALRRRAEELERVDWRGGSAGVCLIEDAADEIEFLRASLAAFSIARSSSPVTPATSDAPSFGVVYDAMIAVQNAILDSATGRYTLDAKGLAWLKKVSYDLSTEHERLLQLRTTETVSPVTPEATNEDTADLDWLTEGTHIDRFTTTEPSDYDVPEGAKFEYNVRGVRVFGVTLRALIRELRAARSTPTGASND